MITITIDHQHPGAVVPHDFAGLSFERGALNPGNAGVTGYLFSPAHKSLVTLFRNMGLHNLRIGGGSIDDMIPAGTGSDGFTGIDNLFAFAAATEANVIYSLRLLNPGSNPIPHLRSVDARIAGHIWQHYQKNLASFAIGNEPDWHSYHTYPGHPLDPRIYETVPGVPGSAYPSYLADWRSFASAVGDEAPQAPLSGPETGAYSTKTFTPSPRSGVSWTQRFARDEQSSGRIAGLTQHYYVGGDPRGTSAAQAIANMLSAVWVNATVAGTQPAGTVYTPYPWLHANIVAPAAASGLSCRLTESNDYLGGVPGASNAFASALWALDYLHWWAARGAAGVNFHNKQWYYTGTIVPDPKGGGYAISPKGYGIKAFSLASAGRVKPVTIQSVTIQNQQSIDLTAYCVGTASEDYLTIINKTHGAGAANAAVTITPPGPTPRGAAMMTLASVPPGHAGSGQATLGGDTITGDTPWNGTWTTLPVNPQTGISLTAGASSAVIVRIST
ncbi:MAG TPA: hypothetical protein VGS62_05580 [Streptosporangiaceae bacterium]|nr:hypothetical protein [Streptosporangiaceae bacterium]